MADTSNGATPEVLRWIASVTTMGAGLGSGSEARAQLIGWAFVVLAVASLIWIGVGYLNGEYALMAQNVVRGSRMGSRPTAKLAKCIWVRTDSARGRADLQEDGGRSGATRRLPSRSADIGLRYGRGSDLL